MNQLRSLKMRRTGAIALVVAVVVSPAAAQTPPTAPAEAWPCRPGCTLRESDELRVTGMDEAVEHGRMQTFDATSIRLTRPDGREVVIGRDHVHRIERRGDSLLNGVLIGAAFGLGTIAAAHPMGADVGAADYIGSTALWAGLGALFDHLHKGWTRIYDRPAKQSARADRFWITPSRSGLRVGFSVSF
jgi:hypothetical protein